MPVFLWTRSLVHPRSQRSFDTRAELYWRRRDDHPLVRSQARRHADRPCGRSYATGLVRERGRAARNHHALRLGNCHRRRADGVDPAMNKLMPELPDVEAFKRYLEATSLHQCIAHVDVLSADLLKGVSGRELARQLRGRRFESTRRHGKHLFVRTDDDIWLRLHFGMTGSLRYFKDEKKAPRHTRVLFLFAKDYRLAFDDQRKFGEIRLIKDVSEFLTKRVLGSDALDVDLPEFKKVFAL